MKKSEVMQWLKDNEIVVDSISLYSSQEAVDEGYEVEPHFGSCDISGERGNVGACMATTRSGDTIEFYASTELIHGHLGSIAGAF